MAGRHEARRQRSPRRTLSRLLGGVREEAQIFVTNGWARGYDVTPELGGIRVKFHFNDNQELRIRRLAAADGLTFGEFVDNMAQECLDRYIARVNCKSLWMRSHLDLRKN